MNYQSGADGERKALSPRGNPPVAAADTGTVTYSSAADAPIRATETYKTDGRVLDWTIELETTGATAVTVGDLAISLPVPPPAGEDPRQIFERGFLRHQFISGSGSFVYFVRASGAPPMLLVTVHPGTRLEYATSACRGGAQA